MTRAARAVATLIVVLAVSAACAAIVIGRYGRTVVLNNVASNGAPLGNPCGQESNPNPAKYFGVITDSNPGTKSYTDFISKAKVHPTLVDYFVQWNAPWDPVPACYAVHQGALPLLQVNLYGPDNGAQPLESIAHNGDNNYIIKFADQVKRFASPVVISLGHEMNGNWYPWGWQGKASEHDVNVYHGKRSGLPPQVFIAFWQKVHKLFSREKVTNVIWLWTVNRDVKPATRPQPWWPGRQYVNWVGIDAHYRYSGDTFNSVFGKTIADVRQVTTTDPILIAETGIQSSSVRPAQLRNLYSWAYNTKGILGVIYFDVKVGQAGRSWPLTDAASITAFHDAVQPFERAATAATKKSASPSGSSSP